MALAPRIEIRQTQSLVMTPQLQQAIKLLQLSNLALADYLVGEVEKNPLLELAPRGTAASVGRRRRDPARRARRRLSRHDGGRGHAARPSARARSARCAAAPRWSRRRLILADELEDDGYLRVPLAEVAGRHR